MSATRYRPVIHQNQGDADRSLLRIRQLFDEQLTYEAIAQTLNAENFKTIRGKQWTALNVRQVIFRLRANLNSWYGLAARRAKFFPVPSEIRANLLH